jgi:hypothetical protein
MLINNLKQFGIGSIFFMFVLLATGMVKAISNPTVVAIPSPDEETIVEFVSSH